MSHAHDDGGGRTRITSSDLSEAQKRDILYNNAARFLRLGDEEMAKHRSM